MNRLEEIDLTRAVRAVLNVFPGDYDYGEMSDGATTCHYCPAVAYTAPAYEAASDRRAAWTTTHPYPQYEYRWRKDFTDDEKKDYQRMANRVHRRQSAWSERIEVEAALPEFREEFDHGADCPFGHLKSIIDAIEERQDAEDMARIGIALGEALGRSG